MMSESVSLKYPISGVHNSNMLQATNMEFCTPAHICHISLTLRAHIPNFNIFFLTGPRNRRFRQKLLFLYNMLLAVLTFCDANLAACTAVHVDHYHIPSTGIVHIVNVYLCC